MNLPEIVGAVTGLACVYLAAEKRPWTWIIGLVNIACYIVLFYQVKLYPDCCLQFVYLAQSIYGWVLWERGNGVNRGLKISKLDFNHWFGFAFATVGLTILFGFFFSSYTQSSYPYVDSFTTSLSLIATYLLSRKIIDNWYIWILANIVSICLYYYKGLYLTSALYIIYIALDIKGIILWKKSD